MPSDPHQSHLLIIKDDVGERSLPLEQTRYSIGRDPTCNIRLISQFVSRHHATLEQRFHSDGSFYYHISDGDSQGQPSANGLLINGRKLRSRDLENKDEVIFGPHVQVVYYLFKREGFHTTPPDEFEDITLINPRTAGQLPEDYDQKDFKKVSDDGEEEPEELKDL
ncbi:FHA domain-containing protein [Phormidesmis sp. 146-33]